MLHSGQEGAAWPANYFCASSKPEAAPPPLQWPSPFSAAGAHSAPFGPPPSLSPMPRSATSSSLSARVCYFTLGAGLLAAWNALITATDYFGTVYPGRHTDRLFTVAYLPVCMITLALGIRFPDLPPGPMRIRLGYAGFTLAMAAVPLLDALLVAPSSAPAPTSGLVAVLVCVGLVGACDGFCQGALFAEAAQLPPPYTHALVSGTATSGLLVCLLRIASKASFESGEADKKLGLRNGTRLYFSLAGLLSLSCLVIYDGLLSRLRSLPSRPQQRTAGQQATAAAISPDPDNEQHPLLLQQPQRLELSRECGSSQGSGGAGGGGDVSWSGSGIATDQLAGVDAPAPPSSICVQLAHGQDDGGIGLNDNDDYEDARRKVTDATASGSHCGWISAAASRPAAASGSGADGGGVGEGARYSSSGKGSGGGSGLPPLRRCMALSWSLCCSLFLTYTVTLSIFPGFLAEDVHSALLGDWYPILLITAFNLADLVGKSLPCLEPSHRTKGTTQDQQQQQGMSLLRPNSKSRSSTCGRMLAKALAALLLPLRRPHGLLVVSVLRGVTALPAFLVAARWRAPAAVMAALTAVLGVSNGYLTSQVLTMGPSAVLAPLPPPPPQTPSRGAQRNRDAVRQPSYEQGSGIGAPGSGYWSLPAGMPSGDRPCNGQPAVVAEAGSGEGSTVAAGGSSKDRPSGPLLMPSVGDGTPVPYVNGRLRGDVEEVYSQGRGQGQGQGSHHDAEVIESLLVLSLVAGLNVGAYLGWLWLVWAV